MQHPGSAPPNSSSSAAVAEMRALSASDMMRPHQGWMLRLLIKTMWS